VTELLDRWPLADHTRARDALVAAYSDSSRGYHDAHHLGEVLDRLAELERAGVGFDPTTVSLAAWFHDAVYDGEPAAEERSAVWAEQELAGTPYAQEVGRLVRLTERHDPVDHDVAGQALCDADLAILASERHRYDEYAAGIRHEYAHVSDPDFRAGRSAVLRELAGRQALFRTPYARERWEPPARRNLARELDRLQ
jgi:predicted metal-dependent HD superfamily phosphohydrolase